ncbi:hypothetical protein MKW92_049919 [Papaver armeniacum]|nr:hypothetical protein MKW92_049919 [Papaver armeniacum]
MEIHCYFSIPHLVLGGLFVFVLAYFFVLSWKPFTKSSKLKRPPEPAGAWPIIGHLPQLMGTEPDKLFHITLAAMADKYGPVFTIRMGVHTVLVVSSWEAAKECFTINDKVFASRPRQVAIRHMGYDSAMFGFAPYGHHWRRIRRVLRRELLSHNRIESLSHVWGSEINISIRELYSSWTENNNGDCGGLVKVEMKDWFSDLTLNLSFMMAVGKRYFGANEEVDNATYKKSTRVIKNFFRLVDAFKEMKKTGNELDALMQEWLEEHKTKRKTLIDGGGYYGKPTKAGEKDWMDVMLSVQDDNPKLSDYYDADIVNKSTCLGLILGGTDTNMVILVWALSSLVNNQIVLNKVHDELDIQVGKDRQVDKSDIKNLVYLQAVLKETLRLYSGPLSGFRVSSEDCTIASYHIPAGTQLLVNSWKIHRDPRVWSNPLEFNPDRFISGGEHVDSDVIGQNFEFIPFGSGRRSCPAISLALQILPLTLARLIHGFEFKTHTDAPIDMTGSAGLSNIKATPLEVLVKPRLASKLY